VLHRLRGQTGSGLLTMEMQGTACPSVDGEDLQDGGHAGNVATKELEHAHLGRRLVTGSGEAI